MCPIYEYACKACGKEFEVLHKVDDKAKECTLCGSDDIERWISGGGFILTGNGWYKPGQN